MRRILLLRFSSMGDVVLLSALVEALHQREEDSEVWLVTKEAYAPLYRDDPRVERVLTLREGGSGLLDLRRRLQQVDFDLILDAHGSLRSRVLAFGLSPAPLRRIAKDTLDRLLFLKARVRGAHLERTQVDRYLALADAEGSGVRPRIVLDAADRAAAERFLGDAEAPLLAVAPGARHRPKQWPLQRYGELVRRLLARGGGEVVLVGSPTEQALCEELAAAFPSRVHIAAGRMGLRETAAVLERSRLLVGNDSGLVHLAEAVGTPAVVIYGPTSREFGYFPLDPRSRVVENELPCRPCSRNGARPCRLKEQLCLTLTTVERVEQEVLESWR